MEKELEVVRLMIEKYCRGNHSSKKGELCSDCLELLDYVKHRRSLCPFGGQKPFCSNCKIHCYKKDKREEIRNVMRYSGPRIIFNHPILVLKHLIETKRKEK